MTDGRLVATAAEAADVAGAVLRPFFRPGRDALLRAEAPLRWVLDPIDGTRAFITGRPVFGTLIGLLDGDTPILGVIDQPVTGERWIGVAGRPTRFRGPFSGEAVCRPCARLAHAELSCTSPEMLDRAETSRRRRLAAEVRPSTTQTSCGARLAPGIPPLEPEPFPGRTCRLPFPMPVAHDSAAD